MWLRVVPSLLVLALVLGGQHALLIGILKAIFWLGVRLLQIIVLLLGGLSFWWVLRSYQLQTEQEVYDRMMAKHKFYQRYRHRSTDSSSMAAGNSSASGAGAGSSGSSGTEPSSYSGSILDAGFQLKVLKRLPIVAHLRTSWNLPPELCDEIARFVQAIVREYITYWFQPISPGNDDFPHDVKFVLADILGAVAARVLEIDSSQALTMTAKGIELFRLHMGWFREAYAQLAEEYPEAFQGEESEANLAKRQEYVAVFAQTSAFLHPGCSTAPSTKKHGSETAEVRYLRHLTSQLLVQLKPQLAQQIDTNVFASMVLNLAREVMVFRVLKPLTEYCQPRYVNELVVASLQDAMTSDKIGPASPTSTIPSASYGYSAAATAAGKIPSMSLNKLRATKMFLYKASRRSGEQAEAALQAIVEAAAAAASTAAGAAENVFDGDDWTDAATSFVYGGLSNAAGVLTGSSVSNSSEKKHHFGDRFALDDRISFPKASKLISAPQRFADRLSNGSSHLKHATSLTATADGNSTGNAPTRRVDDLKNMKANLESSVNSSLSKVKQRFRTRSSNPQSSSSSSDPPPTPGGLNNSIGLASSQAARMMKKPGMLLQKALRRQDVSNASSVMSPMTPTTMPLASSASVNSEALTPPPLTLNPLDSPTKNREIIDEEDNSGMSPSDDEMSMTLDNEACKALQVQERVVMLLDKTISNYVKMCVERPEMRSSARSRELYEFLSAIEEVLMLGFQSHWNTDTAGLVMDESSSLDYRRGTMPASDDERLLRQPSYSSLVTGIAFKGIVNDPMYWQYLAQEREETPFLNDHWRFIAMQCPLCDDSETFYSTRGVQWILSALENGMLWEYFTAMHLNRRVTDMFYDDKHAILRNGRLMGSVLKSLLQLTPLQINLEIPVLLGRTSDMEAEFGVTAGNSKGKNGSGSSNSSTPKSSVRVLEIVWETERYVPIQGWTKAPDKKKWQRELPSSEWIWESDWMLDGPPSSPIMEGHNGDSTGAGWEYAKTFEDKFHDKEKKFDSVRRRKWIRRRRQLPSVLAISLGSKPHTTSIADSLSPRHTWLSEASSSRLQNSVKPVGSPKESVLSPANAASSNSPASKKTFMKRRSFSFDKSSTPEVSLFGEEENVKDDDNDVELSVPKKRSSIPSLRRSSSGKEKDLKTAVKNLRNSFGNTLEERRKKKLFSQVSAPDEDEDDDANDEDEDGSLCFRCLKTLGESEKRTSGRTSNVCQSCQQRVCATCHDFYAFMAFPPPLESSKKAQLCGSCYARLVSKYKLKIEVHVGKYFVKERDENRASMSNGSPMLQSADSGDSGASGLSSPTTAANSGNQKFEVTVQVRDDASYAWSIVKTFADFETLEKSLLDKLKAQEKKHGAGCRGCHLKGVDYSEVLSIQPKLRSLPTVALSYEKKLYVLEEYLQQLLACDTLCQSSCVQKFLLLANATVGSTSSIMSPSLVGSSGEPLESSSMIPGSSLQGSISSASSSFSSLSSSSIAMGLMGSLSAISNSSGAMFMEHGKWRKGRWIAPEANSKVTKMRILQQIEVNLFATLSEIFEFDGISMVRRQLFAVTQRVIKAFLNASHFRMLGKKYLSFADPKKLASIVKNFRVYMFPEESDEPAAIEPASTADDQTLRKDCLEVILASFPSTLVSLFGENSCENAALKVHEFLQHEVFVKNFMFSLVDELSLHLYPEITTYTAKYPPAAAAACTTTPACSTASGKASTSTSPTSSKSG